MGTEEEIPPAPPLQPEKATLPPATHLVFLVVDVLPLVVNLNAQLLHLSLQLAVRGHQEALLSATETGTGSAAPPQEPIGGRLQLSNLCGLGQVQGGRISGASFTSLRTGACPEAPGRATPTATRWHWVSEGLRSWTGGS